MASARWPEKAIKLNESAKKLRPRALDKQKIMQGNHLNQQQPWAVQMGWAASIPCKYAARRRPTAGQVSGSWMCTDLVNTTSICTDPVTVTSICTNPAMTSWSYGRDDHGNDAIATDRHA